MARSAHRREDLFAEASALAERGELTWEAEREACVIGFRGNGAASVYFGEQPVLHFDAAGRLRRMFLQDQQILAQQGTLQLRKPATAGPRMQGHLVDLDPDLQARWIAENSRRLHRLFAAIAGEAVQWRRSTVPPAVLRQRVAELAERVADPFQIGNL